MNTSEKPAANGKIFAVAPMMDGGGNIEKSMS
jgi:hypothetical protein